MGRVHARRQRRPEDDGRDRPRALRARIDQRVLHPDLGEAQRRARHRRGDIRGRLAHHAHPRSARHRHGAGERLRGSDHRRRDDLGRDAARLPALDHPRHLGRRHGRRRDEAALGRPLGRRGEHHRGVDPDDPDGRARRRALLLADRGDLLMRLAPNAQTFYDLFAEAGRNAHAAAVVAEAIYREWPNGPSQDEITRLEHEGDRITTELITNLNQQLIAPFDPDDIFRLTGAIDDVVDEIENACVLLGLYDVATPTKQSLEQCRILVAATGRLELLLASLKHRREADEHLVEVKLLEDEADRVRRAAVASLFRDDRIDPLIVIRWKNIYEALEEAVDACETVAHRVGNILVKNA